MILFKDIYERAIKLYDDPAIKYKYYNDPVGFDRVMFHYLMVAKNKFTSPTAITNKFCEYSEPEGIEESFDGNGSDTYILESQVPNKGKGVTFLFKVGEESISGVYNSTNNSVIFSRKIEVNETCSVTWSFAGAFTADFTTCFRSDFNVPALIDKIITILAYALLSTWGDEEVGRLLEVKNILIDTDFNLLSQANATRARIEWRDRMNENVDSLTSEFTWMIFSTPRGGSRFGK